jgi:hypothetical protein
MVKGMVATVVTIVVSAMPTTMRRSGRRVGRAAGRLCEDRASGRECAAQESGRAARGGSQRRIAVAMPGGPPVSTLTALLDGDGTLGVFDFALGHYWDTGFRRLS